MRDIQRRPNDANVPTGPGAPHPVTPVDSSAPAERFVRAVEQIAIGAARREQAPSQGPSNAAPASGQQPAPTVIYINNAGPQQPTPTPPPTEVHYHTTVHQIARGPSSSRYTRKATSTFGMAAVILGLVSCVACWTDRAQSVAFPVGVLGVGLGALGWIAAALIGRTGAALPFAGVVISALGLTISIVGKEAAQPYLDQIKTKAEGVVEEGRKLIPSEEPNTNTPPTSEQRAPVKTSTPAVHETRPVDPTMPVDVKPKIDEEKLSAAKARLAGAIASVDARLAKDTTYQTAQAIVQQADTRLAEMRNAGKSGTPEMSIAASAALEAHAKLKKLRDAAVESDADVKTARTVVDLASKPSP